MIIGNDLIEENTISFSEFEELSMPFFKLITITLKESGDQKDLAKKLETANTLKKLIGDMSSTGALQTNEEKIKMINLLEKINLQIELIHLKIKELPPTDLKIAGKRLGKKAQSGF